MHGNEGKLQTAEHILSKTLEDAFPDAKVIIAAFNENSGRLEISSKADLRKTGKDRVEEAVNSIINRHLRVSKYFLSRDVASRDFDLSRLPTAVKEVRIVEIEGFDKTPCKDPHVDNTREIGHFTILKLERAGKDRYRFIFKVE